MAGREKGYGRQRAGIEAIREGEAFLGVEGGGGGRQRERVWEAESKHLGNQGRRGFFGGEGAGK